MKLLGLDTSDMNVSTVLQLGGILVAVAIAWGANSVRITEMEKDIASLSRALEMERSERLTYQARIDTIAQQTIMERAFWATGGRFRDRPSINNASSKD